MKARLTSAVFVAMLAVASISAPRPVEAQDNPATAKFIQHAATSELFESEAAKMAAQRAKSDAVRGFAKRMLDEHGKLTAQLTQSVQETDPGRPVAAQLNQQEKESLHQLGAAGDAEFDRLYIDFSIKNQKETLALYQAYAQSGEHAALKRLSTDAIDMVQQQLADARKIQESIR